MFAEVKYFSKYNIFLFWILFCLKRCGLCVGNVEMVRWCWIELLSKFSFSAFRLILTGGLDKGISCLNLPLVMLPLHHDEQKDDYEWWWAHSVNAMLHLIFIILRPGICMPKNVSKFATKQRKSILWSKIHLFKLVYSFDWLAYLLFWLGYLFFIGMVYLVSLAFGMVYLLDSYLFDLHEKKKLSSSSHISRKYGNWISCSFHNWEADKWCN